MTPDVTADGAFRLFGSPVVVTSRAPNTTGTTPTGRAALVDFSQIVVAQDLAPSVTILKERFVNYEEQAIRVVSRYNVGALNSEAIVTLDTL